MRVTVVGAGYVGLATTLAFAHIGHDVVCVERDGHRLSALRARRDPLGEPGFETLLRETRARFEENDPDVRRADVVVFAVGTPMRSDGSADLSQLDDAAGAVAPRAAPGALTLIRSTVPVGTSDRLQSATLQRQIVVSNPEFLREGHALDDTFAPERLVAGGPPEAKDRVSDLYALIAEGMSVPAGVKRPPARIPFLWMSARSAELAKYAANGFLATKLSFVNEIANLAGIVGADTRAVLQALALDPRIGPHHLRPGLGWGGSCFPKDTRALAAMAAGEGYDFGILKAVIEQNNRQLTAFARAIQDECGRGSHIALLGLAFKAGTADTRESPALALATQLADAGAMITAYDPMVRTLPPGVPDLELCPDAASACRGAAALVVATEWPEFAQMDLIALRRVMKGDLLYDGRTIVDAQRAAAAGFRYRGIGVGSLPPAGPPGESRPT